MFSTWIETHLRKAKPTGGSGQYIACCDYHGDENPSMLVDPETGHFCCQACSESGWLDQYAKDHLLPAPPSKRNNVPAHKEPKRQKEHKQWPPPEWGPVVASYYYRNAQGENHIKVDRHESKDFPLYRWENGKWRAGMTYKAGPLKGQKVERYCYHYDKICQADVQRPIIWCEGEKDADLANSLGALATTTIGGSGSSGRLADWDVFRGRSVTFIPDNDDAGEKYLAKNAAKLLEHGAEVFVCRLPGLAEGGDLSDWMAEGHTKEQLTEQLEQAVRYQPPAKEEEVAKPKRERHSPALRDLSRLLVPFSKMDDEPSPTTLQQAIGEFCSAAEQLNTLERDLLKEPLLQILREKKVKAAGTACRSIFSELKRREKAKAKAEKDDGPKQFEKLLDVLESWDLFVDEEFGEPYFSPGQSLGIPLGSEDCQSHLTLAFYRSHNEVATAETMAHVIRLKGAELALEGEKRAVVKRNGFVDGAHYHDLAQDGKVIQIDEKGWRVVDSPNSIYFRRSGQADETLPMPEPGGDVMQLGRLINCSEAHLKLIITWMVAVLWGRAPVPILLFEGPAGSGKSSGSRMPKFLIDPVEHKQLLRTFPENHRDFVIFGLNSLIMGFDNARTVKPEKSDMLARAVTGGAFSARTHYTMTEETVIGIRRPIVMNGISGVVNQPDTASRTALINLSPIQRDGRMCETDLWTLAKELRPSIFGGLLDALVVGIREYENTRPADLPRMADFARFITAAEKALPWEPGEAVQAFRDAQEELYDQALHKDRVALAIVSLMEYRERWVGTSTELFDCLKPPGGGDDYWPRSPASLGKRIVEALPLLQNKDISAEQTRTNSARGWLITKKSPVTAVTPVTETPKAQNGGVHGVTADVTADENPAVTSRHSGESVTAGDGSSDGRHSFSSMPSRARTAYFLGPPIASDGSDGSDGRNPIDTLADQPYLF